MSRGVLWCNTFAHTPLTHAFPSRTLLLTWAHLPLPHYTHTHSSHTHLTPPLSAEFLQEHRHVLEARLQPIVREIADTRARSREELEGE